MNKTLDKSIIKKKIKKGGGALEIFYFMFPKMKDLHELLIRWESTEMQKEGGNGYEHKKLGAPSLLSTDFNTPENTQSSHATRVSTHRIKPHIGTPPLLPSSSSIYRRSYAEILREPKITKPKVSKEPTIKSKILDWFRNNADILKRFISMLPDICTWDLDDPIIKDIALMVEFILQNPDDCIDVFINTDLSKELAKVYERMNINCRVNSTDIWKNRLSKLMDILYKVVYSKETSKTEKQGGKVIKSNKKKCRSSIKNNSR
jgi:hypothetical protein